MFNKAGISIIIPTKDEGEGLAKIIESSQYPASNPNSIISEMISLPQYPRWKPKAIKRFKTLLGRPLKGTGLPAMITLSIFGESKGFELWLIS